MEQLAFKWPLLGSDKQLPPRGDWTTWLLLGGRGSGKTRAGAEWVRSMVCNGLAGRIALVGETYADAREVMVEGESGLLAIHPTHQRPEWTPSRRRLEWPNGAIGQVFSAEDPDGLRGPQFAAAWSDELGKWKRGDQTWNNLQFGLRLGDFPRQVVTTTPRPVPLLKQILKDERTALSHMKTRENADNLAPDFMQRIVASFEGTRLGRQELDGELIEDRADALWSRPMIERNRRKTAPDLARIVVAVDPPVTATATSDACGIIVAGACEEGHYHVLADVTVQGLSPERWARQVLGAFDRFEADCVVIETNQGGDMAERVLRAERATVPVRQVKAKRGKYVRAEPVAHLYELGRVNHVGSFAALEDEMCNFGLDGLPSGKSPDRLDALVWALFWLSQSHQPTPRARPL
ncbi:MAG: terminase family protein [Pseudomonadota bacterium]